jgi:hypothetical protein
MRCHREGVAGSLLTDTNKNKKRTFENLLPWRAAGSLLTRFHVRMNSTDTKKTKKTKKVSAIESCSVLVNTFQRAHEFQSTFTI